MLNTQNSPEINNNKNIFIKKLGKHILAPFLTIFLFIVCIFGIVLPKIEKNHFDLNKKMISHILKSTWKRLEDLDKRHISGELSLKQAQKKAISYYNNLRYGNFNKDYFWILNARGTMIGHPYLKNLEGKDITELKDIKGKAFIKDILSNVHKKEDFFIKYVWQFKDDPDLQLPKVSICRLFKPWNWIIITGVYLDDIDKDISSLKKELVITAVLVLAGVCLLLAYIIFQLTLIDTKKQQIQKKLLFQEHYSKKIIETSPAFFFALDMKGCVISVNESFLEFLLSPENKTKEETKKSIEGCDFIETFIDPSCREQMKENFSLLLKESTCKNNEALIINSAGEKRFARFYCSLLDSDNKIGSDQNYIFGFMVDMTDSIDLHEQLRQSQKMESLGQLAGGIAHDFNNMLCGIVNAAELLEQESSKNEDEKEYISLILKSAEKASNLTQKLLSFSRKGKTRVQFFDINQTIRETANILHHSIDKNIEIKLSLTPDIPCIEGDENQIQNSLLNLGINARDAMPSGGVLTYATKIVNCDDQDVPDNDFFENQIAPPDLSGPCLMISVNDTGQGIPENIQKKIFDPFFTTKDVGKGTGLGLPSVYGTIKEHFGHIDFTSIQGKGTEFRLFLPLGKADP